MRFHHIVVGILLVFMVGVGSVAQEPTIMPEETESPDGTPVPTPAPPPPTRLTIWYPEPLASPGNADATQVIEAQVLEFADQFDDVVVDVRVKKVEDVGGILSTLQSASMVAPGALPDLTLVRRSDLILAVRDQLIQPIDELSVFSQLTEPIQAVGLIDEVAYGLPYMLELQTTVFRPQTDQEYDSWRYDEVLSREEPFIFPASPDRDINTILFLQYLFAGGTMPNNGDIVINSTALRRVLRFYENLQKADLIDESILSYNTPEDYQSAFMNEEFDVAVFNSSAYLSMQEQEPQLQIAPIPTHVGEAAAMLDGWMWVLVSSDADQQALARDYLEWVSNPNRQVEYAETIAMLPSQTVVWEDYLAGVDVDMMLDLVENALLPFLESDNTTLSRIIEDAFVAVIRDGLTANEAAENAQN